MAGRLTSAAAVRRLLDWYRRRARDLPWRRSPDPYRVWVSEVMLQQTRAETVSPYYERFLKRFPNVAALAAADESRLLECWAGLGYYRRARLMRDAARKIRDELGGELPRDEAGLRGLPGVGEYTAAAVASIAFDEPRAALDGNVMRVVSRLDDDPRDIASAATRAAFRRRAQELLETLGPGEYGDFNQAMMELGATVCARRSPDCAACPLAVDCLARQRGTQRERPVKSGRQERTTIRLTAAIVVDGDRVMLRRRPADAAVMPGFWEAPTIESADGRDPTFEFSDAPPLGLFRHAITFRDFIVEARLARPAGEPPPGHRWTTPAWRRRAPLTTITRKALRLWEAHRSGERPERDSDS